MSLVTNDITDGVVLTGPQFSEPMRVIGTPSTANGFVLVNLVGTRTNTFRGGVTLSNQDLASIEVERKEAAFQGRPRLFKLGLEAIRISLAQEYDPYFGLSISRVDPLPHQLDAVYNHLLKSARCRFLLADDAGAGKTIMAGLLLKELKLRGLVDRVLIVCPANLAFQWQREMADRFQETFHILRGADLRVQYGVNLWNDKLQIITSMDLAKREEILPSVRQADDWDLIIVDEAHRMSARDAQHKSERYQLGELLRDKTAHFLLLTATPHKGDPTNFSLFLQLLDQEAYADVKSIHDAMDRREAACYLRRTKEAMLNFPKPQADGTWKAVKLFKRRIPHTVAFSLEGEEMALYQAVTHYVQRQSARAAESNDQRRARAVGFIMAMYQRRMASSTHALRQSLLRRQKALKQLLETANQLGDIPMPEIPSQEEWEEMDDAEREAKERELERATLARRKPDLEAELKEIAELIEHAQRVEDGGFEIKLSRLKAQLTEQGIFARPELRLLIFTEYKDTLDYLVARFKSWNLTVGQIHGSMKPGSRDEEGTRLWAERNFWDLKTQVLVATEAAGEGINLHCCHVLFNYDIPWNPNRLEQRMGRIHRYGQTRDCLIFNFFAQNTVEGRVLQKLVEKLQEIRDALDDDAVFNVVGEVLPSNQIERLLRDFYAGKLSANDLEARLEVEVREEDFRRICQSALEGLAKTRLNLPMLVERRALAQERRIVPETVARFFEAGSKEIGLPLTPINISTASTVSPGAVSCGTGVPPVILEQDAQTTRGYNPLQPVERRQGAFLPHWTQEGATYAVTFRLFDALPSEVLQQWLAEREDIVKTARQLGRELSDAERERLDQLHSERVERWLDAGHGCCFLRNGPVAELIASALRYFDGQRYDLFAWCAMPNHVHVVFRPQADWTLSKILHSWKSYTAKEANRILGRSGEFWQDEYYDHLVRNDRDFEHQVRYVLENPSKAGLQAWTRLGRAVGLLPHLYAPGTAPDDRVGQDGQATMCGTGVSPVAARLHGQDAHAANRAFRVGKIPVGLFEQARAKDWRLPQLAKRYDRICFDRSTLEADPRLEWVTPGHPLFEALRRRVWEQTQPQLRQGAVFYELEREQPALLELFIASVADGVGNILHVACF